jgi:hypothetical protein
MRPQYLKDIISLSAGEAGQKALRALTKLCNFLLSGQLPSEICHLLYGASLCALNKKMEELDRSLSETVCED